MVVAVKDEYYFSHDKDTSQAPSQPQTRRWRLRRLNPPDLRLRISERRLLLLGNDLLLLNAALLAALALRGGFPLTPTTILSLWKWFVTLGVIWWLWAQFFDIYDLARAASPLHSLRSSAMTVVAAVLTYTFTPALTPPLQARSLHLLFGLAALLGIALWRLSYALLFVQPSFNQRALIVGAGRAGRTLLAELQKASAHQANPFRGTGYELLGFIDDNPELIGQTVGGLPVLGDHKQLVQTAVAQRVDEVILAITFRHALSSGLFNALLMCREAGMRLTTMPTIYERLLKRVPVEHLGGDFHLVMPMNENQSERLYGLVKRGFDIAMALVGMIPLGLLIPIVALANRLTSPGPLFYTQERVGRSGQCFCIIKFRSMRPDAESNGAAVWACQNDPRVTPIGRFLRKTRLDELPQVINVLRGEMSIIGPRPERPEFVDRLAAAIPFYRARHAVRPGITGWAQVCYRYGDSVEDARLKLEYDLYYVTHCSFLLDLIILLKTAAIMLQFKGR